DAQFLAIGAVGDVLQGPLQERVLDLLGLLLEGEQALAASLLGEADDLVDDLLWLVGRAALERCGHLLEGVDRILNRAAGDADRDRREEHEDHGSRQQEGAHVGALDRDHGVEGTESEPDADDGCEIHQIFLGPEMRATASSASASVTMPRWGAEGSAAEFEWARAMTRAR